MNNGETIWGEVPATKGDLQELKRSVVTFRHLIAAVGLLLIPVLTLTWYLSSTLTGLTKDVSHIKNSLAAIAKKGDM